MKRSAEKQLSKDDGDGDDDQDIQEGHNSHGFKKADDATLAGRPIRGLPKRSLAAISPPPLNGTETPRLSGFSGFGQQSPGGSAFSYTPPPNAPPAPMFSNSSTPVFGDSQKPPFPTNALPVSSSASSATKTFASFLNNSNTPPAFSLTPSSDESEDPAVKYYRDLRGLNVSFVSALKAAVDRDPFTDAAELLERYKSLRQDIQKDFDDQKSRPNRAPTSEKAACPPKPPPPSMPTPPSTAFAGFTPLPSSSPVAPAAGSGFTPSAPPSFSFPQTAASSMTPFGLTPSAFNSDSAQKPKPTSTSAFGSVPTSSSPFGYNPPSSTFSDPFKPAPDEKPKDPATANLFGSPSQSPVVFGGGDNKPLSAPANSFSGSFTFGSSSNAKKGSIGNPVGFGFGSGSRSPPEKLGETNGGGSSGSVFGEKPKEMGYGDGDTAQGEGEGSIPGGGEEDTPKMLQNNPHDEEGAGEEEEETVYTARAKVYKLVKGTESSKWADLGVGMLRLKRHKESGARRVLLRNSGTGKITLNFKTYPGLSPSLSAKFVSFMGHEEGVATSYKLRIKDEEQAKELKEALDREVAAVNNS